MTTKITELKERIVDDWDEQWSNYNPVNDTGVGVPPWSGGDYEQMKDFISQALHETIKARCEKLRMERLDEGWKRTEQEPSNDEKLYISTYNSAIDVLNQKIDQIAGETRRQTLEDVMIIIARYAKESYEEVSNPDEVENDYEFPFYDKSRKEIVDEMIVACEVVRCDCGEPIKDWDICDSVRELKKLIKK